MKTPMQLIEDKLNESGGREFYRWVVINLPMLAKREQMFIDAEKNRLSKKKKTEDNIVLDADLL